MNCGQAQRALSAQLDDDLNGRAAEALAGHLTACGRCRAERDGMVRLRDAARARCTLSGSPNAMTMTASGRSVRAAVQRFQEEQEEAQAAGKAKQRGQSNRRLPQRPSLRAALALAAASAIAAFAWLTDHRRPSFVAVTPAAMATRTGDAPTDERHNAYTGSKSSPDRSALATVQTEQHMSLSRSTNRIQTGRASAGAFGNRQTPPVPMLLSGKSKAASKEPEERASAPLATSPLPRADDLAIVNGDPAAFARLWTRLPADSVDRLERTLLASIRGGDDFIAIPLPRLAAATTRGSRRVAAEALTAYKRERQIVDARLQRKVTLAAKGIAFSELCRQLTESTGVTFTAGRAVADDKVTVFCRERPVRDLMRQVSGLFNFTWQRSGEEGAYTYYLTQTVRAQLLEEELRNRDQNEALLALDRQMERYRKYGDLSPEQAAALAQTTASAEDRHALEVLASPAGAAVQLYAGLSPEELAGLRDGRPLQYGPQPDAGERELPRALAERILGGLGQVRIVTGPGGQLGFARPDGVAGVPPVAVPAAHASATLRLERGELGRLSLWGGFGVTLLTPTGERAGRFNDGAALAMGESPAVAAPDNATANARLAAEPALKKPITIRTQPSCRLGSDPYAPPFSEGAPPRASSPAPPPPALPESSPASAGSTRSTTADVLEAIHRATGQDVIGDYYTRLYAPADVSVTDATLFRALCRLADTMRARWGRHSDWLTFRSTSFFNDRLKEVPVRLLERWAASRRSHGGVLTVEDLAEIAELSDARLDSGAMAEGARAQYGLQEWELARSGNLRSHWRLLAALPRSVRVAATSARGIPLAQLPLPLQQQLLGVAFRSLPERVTPEGLVGVSLQLRYTPPPPQKDVTKIASEEGKTAAAAPGGGGGSTNPVGIHSAGAGPQQGPPRWHPEDSDVVVFTYVYGGPNTERFQVVRRLYSESVAPLP